MSPHDTIFALSSGPPPAGIAVVRMSGPDVRFGLETLAGFVPEPRVAVLRPLKAADGGLIDQSIVLFFPGPGSFTGEDVAELQVHGGRAVVAAVLSALSALPGFRPAEAGEFTRRALANERIDLTQVEGLADLIAAETEAQRRQAVAQAGGALGALAEAWRQRLVRARALIEAELDFPDEEDIPGAVSVQAWDIVAGLEKEIVNHLADQRGERVRDGFEVVILGPPNVGKSSLLNAIAQRDVAIVTPEAGTTRDLIEVRLDLGGYAVTLVDTAGLRETESAVEQEGIRRAEERARAADLVLWLSDGSGRMAEAPLPDAIRVRNKIDLTPGSDDGTGEIGVSAKTGQGIAELLAMVTERVAGLTPGTETPLITRARHRAALESCRGAMVAALNHALPLELRAEELRHAGDALGRITGKIDVEDMLDVIFRDFCIGK
jgi:tRNA modification GTPase